MARANDRRIPVTVLTGFLGSGKTTLLNHILTSSHGKRLAIIENEFGEVGIDDELLRKNTKVQTDEEIIEMMNGCICCTVRQDLIAVLKKLAMRQQAGQLKLDGIVIETTGMADPAPIAQTFFVDDAVEQFARLDGIVTLVDAKHIEQHLDEEKPEGVENEAVEQLAFADRMLLNKTDLVSEVDLERIEARLREINAFAPIKRCIRSEVSVDSVLDLRAFDLKRTLENEPEFLNTDGEHQHDTSVTSVSINLEGDANLDDVENFFQTTLTSKGADIYRTKGVIAIAHAKERFVYQAVHMILNSSFEEPWKPDELRRSKLVFIGKNLDKADLTESFKRCLATPGRLEEKLQSLRFRVGDKVHCKTGPGPNDWRNGVVVQLMYRDEHMPPGVVAPYQVNVSYGGLIYAPEDDDEIIRPGHTGSRCVVM